MGEGSGTGDGAGVSLGASFDEGAMGVGQDVGTPANAVNGVTEGKGVGVPDSVDFSAAAWAAKTVRVVSGVASTALELPKPIKASTMNAVNTMAAAPLNQSQGERRMRDVAGCRSMFRLFVTGKDGRLKTPVGAVLST